MPHEHKWLDDPIKRKEAELLAIWEHEAQVIKIQNQVIRTVLIECPFQIRSAADCQFCGNEACLKAWRKQNELWGLTETEALLETEAACHADSVRKTGNVANYTQSAQYRSAARRKSSDHPGDLACGSSLFDFEDKAA